MPSFLDSSPAAGDWSSLYLAAQEPVKAPRHGLVMPPPAAAAAAAKRPAYGGGRRIKNFEMCTEALGCETGGVDGAAAIAAAEDVMAVETDCAERKRRAREEAAAESMVMELEAGRVRRAGGALPPPLTTLARGGSRVRMVHERRDGRLAVYAVRTAGVQAERCGGRLRLRLVPCAGCSNAAECHQKEKQLIKEEAEEAAAIVAKEEKHDADDEDEHGSVAKYVRGGRCMEAEVAAAAAAAARRGKKWEPEQAAPFWVATS
ncbi:protein FANTASTIC FOUR 1-like [Oryza brachyantha]|uniref:protein FANTASTIC FOUR 1-like n=1 Tax=Oryza brachyantha TaxID=4533 RepID=UPI001ADA2FB2|nr:protein FANTASTIC FOUR 1-like [Oryza brachyantha]